MVNIALRMLLAAVLLAALAVTQTVQASIRGEGITAAPCPAREWQLNEQAFEALPGATVRTGRYEGGLYRIEIPDAWNGELVLWAHGFVDDAGPRGSMLSVGNPGAGNVGEGRPFRQHLIATGFAWAASSYRCNGYVPGIGLLDTLALPDLFATTVGRTPARTYLVGGSMGGHATILGLQEYPRRFDGGLAMCPAGAGEFDFLVDVKRAAERITGTPIGTPFDEGDAARLLAVFGTPPALTAEGRQLADHQIAISGGPRPFAMEGLTTRFAANVRDGARVAAELADRDRYEERVPFDGAIERPLMTLHGTGDLFVPVSIQQTLRAAVDAAGRAQWLVQRLMRIPGHCAFSRAEQARAFDDLVRWVRSGVRPDGDDVRGDLSDAGRRFTDPLRPGDPGGVSVAATSR